jgi:uncharacterized protein VirK/YbjX
MPKKKLNEMSAHGHKYWKKWVHKYKFKMLNILKKKNTIHLILQDFIQKIRINLKFINIF